MFVFNRSPFNSFQLYEEKRGGIVVVLSWCVVRGAQFAAWSSLDRRYI